MMKSLTKNMPVVLTVLALFLAFILYNTFFKSEGTSFVSDPAVKAIGADIVKTYTELQAISFDQSIFDKPEYEALVDFGVALPSQQAGRTNPFDILGRN